jgi:hypothetical protein
MTFDTSAPLAFKTSTPDWIADLEQSILDELSTRTTHHSPVLVDVVGDTSYAICANCEQNVEAWLDDESMRFGNFGTRVEFANGATLNKVCKM